LFNLQKGVNSLKLLSLLITREDTSGTVTAGVVDTGSKFFFGVIDTGDAPSQLDYQGPGGR
jgi:hypothetical protein